MSETLKYPAGEWTHGDFADLNGKTKPSVYNQLQEAIKTGKVVKTEKRSAGGKGKPSQYYKVADANTVVTIAPKAPEPTPEKITEKSVVKSETPVEVKPEPVVIVDVVAAPVSEKIVENITVSTVPASDPTPHAKVEPVATLAPDTHSSDHKCPVCQKNLLTWKTQTGTMVKCLQPIEVCKSTENPFGHGRNEKDAYETLVAKWGFATKGSAAV